MEESLNGASVSELRKLQKQRRQSPVSALQEGRTY